MRVIGLVVVLVVVFAAGFSPIRVSGLDCPDNAEATGRGRGASSTAVLLSGAAPLLAKLQWPTSRPTVGLLLGLALDGSRLP